MAFDAASESFPPGMDPLSVSKPGNETSSIPAEISSQQEPPRGERSGWMRFFDTFLQEGSIQWILGVGMLILLGSSLMLVTSHWDSYTPVWKHLILLGYTAGIHLAGQFAFHSLGLRKTGTALMVLTVLLLPITFLALHWVHPDDVNSFSGMLHHAGLLTLLAVNGTFATLAATRIFRHFLRSTQPTFLVAYLVLCVAGAFVPLLPEALAPVVTLGLWLVFAAGAVKVNRHVFWLTEERRLPRVCGFFPILLLGGQFLALFSAGLSPHVPLEWIGFGLVLTAIPVLLTADVLARVFQEVHGSVARPLPWSIVAPIFVGLTSTLAGVCLAGLRFPNAGVLVPTAALAAVLMGVVARRTGKAAFVWAMLAGVLLAYQCSPVFFREFALRVVDSGAAAVHEARLPLAFYGLTYLPLFLTTSLLAVWRLRRDDTLFGPGLKRFSLAFPVAALAASLTHGKAAFPVGLALTTLFVLQAHQFRSPKTLWLSLAGFLSMTNGFTHFATQVLGWAPSNELPLVVWTLAATLLLVPGTYLDRRSLLWRPRDEWDVSIPACRVTSLLVTLGCAGVCLAFTFASPVTSPVLIAVCMVVALLLAAHAVHWPHHGLGDLFFAFVAAAATLTALSLLHNLETLSAASLVGFLVLWCLAPSIMRFPATRIAAAFGKPAQRVSTLGMVLLFATFCLRHWSQAILLVRPQSHLVLAGSVLMALWAFDAARRWNAAAFSVAGWVAILGTSAAIGVTLFGAGAPPWIPALWGALAVLAIVVLRVTRTLPHDSQVPKDLDAKIDAGPSRHVIGYPIAGCAWTTLLLIALASLVIFTTPMRVAGGVALGGLLLLASLWNRRTMRRLALMVTNWQVLCGLVQVFAPGIRSLDGLHLAAFAPAAFPVALVSAMQALLWQRAKRDDGDDRELLFLHAFALQLVAGVSLLCALERVDVPLTFVEIGMIVATFGTLIADQILSALQSSAAGLRADANSASVLAASPSDSIRIRAASGPTRRGEGHVWCAQVMLLAGIGYLALFDVVRFGHGFGMYVILASGIVAWSVARAAERSPRTAVLVHPFSTTGFLLPAVTVVLGVMRPLLGLDSVWLGMNSLALLLAAGFYFWQGIERKATHLVVASAAILNVALALLWRELDWFDPQFFLIPLGISVLGLVELLRQEIPDKAIDPLRYVGALVILVSPTFHIVEGSWPHLLSLMVVSVGVTLTAMGLRIRALMYAGTAFLTADVVAMVVRGSIDEPSVLWIAGIGLGLVLIGLAAYCERHREKMLQRLRMIAAELESWN